MKLIHLLQNLFIHFEYTKSTHLYILIAFSIVALTLVFLLVSSSKTKKSKINNAPQTPPPSISSHDIKAIAGDDVITTQLDLARAYIELDKFTLAKKILEHVVEHGNSNQQDEAKKLMETT